MEYNCALIKVDWLAVCIVLSVVGAVFENFLQRWRKFCTVQSSSKWEARVIPVEMSQAPLTNKKQGNLDKYTPLKLLSQRKLGITARNRLFALLNHWSTQNFLKMAQSRTDHTCHLKQNPSHETVSLRLHKNFISEKTEKHCFNDAVRYLTIKHSIAIIKRKLFL